MNNVWGVTVLSMFNTRKLNATHQAKPSLLFVDDDPIIVDALSIVLADSFDLIIASSRQQVKKQLQDLSSKPSLALIDLGLPPKPYSPEEGFKLVEELMVLNHRFKILILSGQDSDPHIHHALTLGAVDFIRKPCDMDLLKVRLDHQVRMLQAESTAKAHDLAQTRLLGNSEALETLRNLVKQFADTDYLVLVEGESGTGKELVAEELHNMSSRAKRPFLTINCAAFTPELLESQLFGHIKGAFTGANVGHVGFFEEATDGTLFLDEIGDLSLPLQSKLLRVLENGEFYRVGETTPCISRARIIAATNRDLKEEVRQGRFRMDLYHRLSVLTIQVPPLRARKQDLQTLLTYFKKIYATGNATFEIKPDALKRLEHYHFPGNIRELRNIVIRLTAKFAGKTVDIDDVQAELESDYNELALFDGENVDDIIKHELNERGFQLDDKVADWERRYVNQALLLSHGNLSQAARLLGINRTTLYSRLQRLNLKNDLPTTLKENAI